MGWVARKGSWAFAVMMFVLYESALGYAMFEIAEAEEIGANEAAVQVCCGFSLVPVATWASLRTGALPHTVHAPAPAPALARVPAGAPLLKHAWVPHAATRVFDADDAAEVAAADGSILDALGLVPCDP